MPETSVLEVLSDRNTAGLLFVLRETSRKAIGKRLAQPKEV
jgi:hypothetical protein